MAAAIGFGAYIALTSLVGIFLGVHAGDGWLAILYGTLGITMGLAALASPFVRDPIRSGLLGWSVFGIGTRAVIDLDFFGLTFSVPVALVVLAVLVVVCANRPSVAKTIWCVAGALLSVIAFALLAVAAPHLPVICPPTLAAGQRSIDIAYPSDNTWPFDDIGNLYFDRC